MTQSFNAQNTYTLAFEIAKGEDFRTAAPTWTDISDSVRRFRVERGRQTELDRIEAGVLVAELSNDTRKFDPAFDSQVKVGVPVRVRVIHDAVTYPVFYGFAEEWRLSWPGKLDAVCTLTATDFFAWLSGQRWETYRRVVAEDKPVAYWRLDETGGSTVRDSVSNGAFDAAAKGSNNIIGDGTGVFGGSVAPASGSAAGYLQTAAAVGLQVTGPLTVELWVYHDAAQPITTSTVLVDCSSSLVTADAAFRVTASEFDIHMEWGDGTFAPSWRIAMVDVDWHHIVWTRNADASVVRAYVDGVEQTVTFTGTDGKIVVPAVDTDRIVTIGARFDGAEWIGNGSASEDTRIAHVAVYDRILEPDEVEAHYNANNDTFTEATTNVRIGAILNEADWPAGLRNLDTGNITLPAIAIGNETLIEQLRQIEIAEQGLLFHGPDGNIEFRDGHSRLTQTTTSQATYGSATSELDYTEIEWPTNRELVYNDVRVESRDRGPRKSFDATSQNAYGIRTLNIDGALIHDPNRALNLAQAYVHRFKDPHQRPEQVVVMPDDDEATAYPEVLGNEIGTRITVNHDPVGAGTDISGDFFIEHIVHDVMPESWVTIYRVSPVDDVWEFWIVADATYGVLGTTTRAGY